MATNYSGFAEGFQGGFGLMSDAMDRARLRDIQEQEREDMANYRLDQTNLEKEKFAETKRANQLAETRAEEQRIADNEARTADQEIRRMQAENLKLQREREKAATDENIARAERERKDKEKEERLELHAEYTNELIGLADLPAEQRNSAQNLERIDFIIKELTGSQFFDPSTALSGDVESYNAEITALLNRIQSGEEINAGDISAGARAAMTEGLTVNNARFVGSKISAEAFPQAPASAAGGTIMDVTIHDVSITSGTPANPETGQAAVAGQLQAKVAVKYKTKDGKIGYYYPDLTDNRDGTGSPFSISLNEAAQAYAGRARMIGDLKANPKFKELVDERLIERDHGGIDKFNSTVKTMTDTIITQLEKAETVGTDIDSVLSKQGPNYGGILQEGEDAQDLINNVQALRERVRERLLYGRTTTSKIERSDAFLNQTRSALKTVSVGSGERVATTNRRGRKVTAGEAMQGLEEFLGTSIDNLSAQQVVQINEFFSSDGSITPENMARLREFRDTQIVKQP